MQSMKASCSSSALPCCSCSSPALHQAWRPAARRTADSNRSGSSQRMAPLRAGIPNEADSLYKGIPVASGLINRRLMDKQMKKENKEFVSAMKLAEDDVRREQLLRRESRTPATNEEELVEYFLNTLAEDMDFEVARCRPMLNQAFFRYLDKIVGEQRFSLGGEPDEERLIELEALRQYLTAACEVVDQTVAKTSSAKDRLAKLLSSRDKKATILEMAESNEIDQALMDLLQQNIQAARAADQEEPAKFMEKVMQACAKFYVAPTLPASALPALPPTAPAAGAAGLLQQMGVGGAPPSDATAPAAAPPSIIIPGAGGAARKPRQANMGVPILGKPQQQGGGGSGLILPGR